MFRRAVDAAAGNGGDAGKAKLVEACTAESIILEA
jgi:hypothetical protein